MLAALRWKPWPVLAGAGLAAAVALGLVLFAPATLNLETGSVRELDRATSGRANLIGGGLRMVRDRPVLGYGSGSYAERYREREHVSSEKVAAASHTIPLTVTAEQGVIGLAAYLALVALSFALLFDGLRRTTIALAGRRPDRPRRRSPPRTARWCCTPSCTPRTSRTRCRGRCWRSRPGCARARSTTTRSPAPAERRRRWRRGLVTLVRPEFEPTLPALRAAARRGARAHDGRAAAARARALVVAVAARAPARGPHQRGRARREPAFTLEYHNDLFDSVRAAGGRARAARGPARPPGGHDHRPPAGAAGARGRRRPRPAPVYASGHIERLAGESDRFRLRAQHRARINDAPGYEVRFRTGPPGRCTFGSDMMLLPAEEETRGGLLLSLRREVDGPREAQRERGGVRGSRERGVRSVRFGTGPG